MLTRRVSSTNDRKHLTDLCAVTLAIAAPARALADGALGNIPVLEVGPAFGVSSVPFEGARDNLGFVFGPEVHLRLDATAVLLYGDGLWNPIHSGLQVD